MNTQTIKLSLLLSNSGQIEGLPKNPRLIRDERFSALVKSIQDDPEMLDLRELIVYSFQGKFIIIAGNMRFKAMKELGYAEAPCKVLPENTPIEKLRAYTIKDNNSFGENDLLELVTNWDQIELSGFGMELEINSKEKKEKVSKSVYKDYFILKINFQSENELKKAYEELKDKFECEIIM
ncbi:hypothetical protein [Leptospira phage LE4]|uniref:ParB-like N-terminal domain-containing protein n=1 Tax=Leptospira phage LE4 TaxID=2041383 RepID=A0A343LEB7_9CAUD|nr:hypothetical protein HWB34_gp14 [Leptospira phage LE4]ATN95027.1 hypothetical protein [Leptospira phage LE4]